ncbi:tripartite tricarboxylate transporter TctB family protein [Neorhizobium galegae]|uniref:tripartite tricarboxylate transporter TctB family protein n=1 Tax=Neorhizobium galegae TaxID=399 RepID=UPI000621FCFA|nr:tripartite tricarboxylate transporter TctB family protein [Neorhizobium galegae]CDZ60347.1 Tripartite tricarboxylate transporter TctB family [Neorhizobium galegae bv. orientalis]MCQ1574477.1 tripartite tricarboxylate transporter TctB family protein [Neorhizobium galegae]MCQ1810350.1 tripartite tricarboxylate transporter TctB family protein [Neorhizobium galegae]MCQ1838922.1 tripartite tricarboxylate transporter TctB family protein [Neorhizobium galegae]UIK08311.1 tripartite tricarboxylate t
MVIKSPQDFGAGILFILFGAVGLYVGSDLSFGSARNMGPGYFPMIICGLIALIGLIVAVKSLAIEGPAIERIQFRPIVFILLAIAAFGILIAEIGAVISSILLIMFAAYARRDVKPVETVIFAVTTAAFVVIIFVYALGQPMPVWWGR